MEGGKKLYRSLGTERGYEDSHNIEERFHKNSPERVEQVKNLLGKLDQRSIYFLRNRGSKRENFTYIVGLPPLDGGTLLLDDSHVLPARQQLDRTVPFDGLSFCSEIPLRSKTPVQGADDPILETLDVKLNVSIDFLTPRRQGSSIGFEFADTLMAQFTSKVHGRL